MPIYHYESIDGEKGCDYCKKSFQTTQSINDAKLDTCPQCGSKIRRIICAPALGHSKTDLHYRAKRAGFKCMKKVQKGEYETIY
ncbi:MAG: zinc ribbon domain-containing protein [Kiritimatiellae bacterium]|nr:zinc ribbon domain-containing protein [Kiritimatiellia bacterium]